MPQFRRARCVEAAGGFLRRADLPAGISCNIVEKSGLPVPALRK